jgi:hypothetical protein
MRTNTCHKLKRAHKIFKCKKETHSENQTCDPAARALLVHDDLFELGQLLRLNNEAVRAVVGFANQRLWRVGVGVGVSVREGGEKGRAW